MDHIRICIEDDVESGETGFGQIRLNHAALPEIDFDEIDCSTKFLGKKLGCPVIIEALTGGTSKSKAINRDLASVAQEMDIGLGVGSQRAAIEYESLAGTYAVRDVAEDILLIANLGAVQLNYGYGIRECEKAVEMISADALALHINPLQEAIQPEGNKNFAGLTQKINSIAEKIKEPLIAKEVGCGISGKTAEKLKVDAFDVGGLGGTNWALIESERSVKDLGRVFSGWGIPTAESVKELVPLGKPVIASGGVRTGLDAVKALAIGAECVGVALPVLRAWDARGVEGVRQYLGNFVDEMKTAMFLSGAKKVSEIQGILAN